MERVQIERAERGCCAILNCIIKASGFASRESVFSVDEIALFLKIVMLHMFS
jgi:hypothetical protein